MANGMMNLTLLLQNKKKVIKIVKGNKDYTCVPLQGSGSFGVEVRSLTLLEETSLY